MAASPQPVARPAPFRLLDVLRGLASLAVVAFHWGEIAERTAPELQNNFLYRACHFGFLGVQVFFVISGFCIAAAAAALLSKQKSGAETNVLGLLKTYLTARARRIFPTYWAGLALVLLFSWAATQLAQAGRIQDNIYTHFDLAHTSPVLMAANVFLIASPLQMPLFLIVAWTLCYEAAFYLVIGAALGLAAAQMKRGINAQSGILFMLNVLHTVTLGSLIWLLLSPRSVPFPLELWPHFGLGIFVYDLLTPPSLYPLRKRGVGAALGASLVLMAAFVIFRNVDIGGMSQPARLTFATSGSFAVLLLWVYRFDKPIMGHKAAQWLSFLGLFSYSLYLTHTVVLRVAGQILQKAHLFPRWHSLAFLLALGICVGAAYGFFLLFEKPLLSRRKIQTEPVP